MKAFSRECAITRPSTACFDEGKDMTAYRFGMTTLVVLALLLASTQAWGARFFRYKDETGRLVISHTIPNDRVKFGYEIVDENARLIQTIEPQLSEEEYQALGVHAAAALYEEEPEAGLPRAAHVTKLQSATEDLLTKFLAKK